MPGLFDHPMNTLKDRTQDVYMISSLEPYLYISTVIDNSIMAFTAKSGLELSSL